MAVRVQIGEIHNHHVAFEVAGPIDPDADELYDRGWTTVGVLWADPGFEGRFDVWAQLSDFERLASLLDDLYSNLDGAGEWSTFEGNVHLKFSGDGRGHFEVSVEFMADGITGPWVRSSVTIDQTEIPQILRSLRVVETLR